MSDIHKAAGIIVRDKKLLVARAYDKTIFMAPGGKLEDGETHEESLIRELKEEFDIDTTPENFTHFGSFSAPAVGQEKRMLYMEVFTVNDFKGEIGTHDEIEELCWIDSSNADTIEVGSIFKHEVLPRLQAQKIIN